ncbi:MAG: hypothetical protein DRP01_09065 [Archaeoglobales archaeon]|nr:MAG: hypothetical protein DRP01_09065 [Archaeoglobales archaeon]
MERVIKDIARQFKACIALRGGKVLSWVIGRVSVGYLSFCAVCDGVPPHLVLILAEPTRKDKLWVFVSFARKDTLDKFELETTWVYADEERSGYRGVIIPAYSSRKLGCAIADDIVWLINTPSAWTKDRISSSIKEEIIISPEYAEAVFCQYYHEPLSMIVRDSRHGYYTIIYDLTQTMCSAPSSLYGQHLLQFLFKYILAI